MEPVPTTEVIQMRHITPTCMEILMHFERGPNGSFAARRYQGKADRPGVWTIGWGHVIKPGEQFDEPLDEDAAYELLWDDAQATRRKCNILFDRRKIRTTQEQFDALVSLAFNVGVGVHDGKKGDFADSTLLDYMERQQTQLAAAEFDKWVYSAGRIQPGLVRRRKCEKHLFLTGQLNFFER